MHLALVIFVVLVIVGSLVWLAYKAPFIDATFKEFIKYAAIVGCVIWMLFLLLRQTGVNLP